MPDDPQPQPNSPAGSPAPQQPQLYYRHSDTQPAAESWASKVFTRDDLKAHASLGKFKSADDFGARYVAIERQLSSHPRVSIPGPEATDEQRAEFYSELGRPESPDKYSVGAHIKELFPEGTPVNEPFVKGAFEAFHRAGLNDRQVTAVVNFYAEKQQRERDVSFAVGLNALRHQWGAKNFDREWAVTYRAVDALTSGRFAIPGMKEFVKNPLFSNSLPLARVFHLIGTLMSKGAEPAGAAAGLKSRATSSKLSDPGDELQIRKSELMRRDGPYWSAAHPDHMKAVQEVARINQQIIGG